jgi:O-6-methylguanine DNA methyltransferase
MEAKARFEIDSPVGRLRLAATDAGLTDLRFGGAGGASGVEASEHPQAGSLAAQRHLDAAAHAIESYFEGERRHFDDLQLAPSGTPFQLRVWRALCEIPYGATESYGGLARRIGQPGASRAVGLANNRNPISILVPCHRVIGADGRLVGYGGGLAAKERLLTLEGALVPDLFSKTSGLVSNSRSA